MYKVGKISKIVTISKVGVISKIGTTSKFGAKCPNIENWNNKIILY